MKHFHRKGELQLNSKHDNGDDALEQCLASVVQTFEANRNEQNAISMKKYMKDNFDFLGMKAHFWK